MKRILSALLVALGLSVPAYAQQWDQVNGSMQVKSGPSAPLVIIDQTAAGQKIASFRNNGTEKCYIDVSGNLNCAGTFTLTGQFLAADGLASAPSYSFASATNTGIRGAAANVYITTSGTDRIRVVDTETVFHVNQVLEWASTGVSSPDVALSRFSAGRFMQANGLNAQRWDVLNTYTSATNNEAFSVDWQTAANSALVGTRTAATGTGRRMFLSAQKSSAADDYAGISVSPGGTPAIQLGFFQANGTATSQSSITQVVGLGIFTSTATSGTIIPVSITPTYNQSSGTAANTDLLINRTETAVGSGSQRLIDAQTGGTSRFYITAGGASGRATQEVFTQSTAPTCTSANNCGTGNGTFSTGSSDTAGRVTLGTTPASGFIITFNQAWASPPVCMVMMDKAGMVVGKMPLTAVTTTGQITVVTNGTAPATGDIYTYRCTGLQ